MRIYLLVLGLGMFSTALGTSVGDTYQKVIDDNGPPKSALGGGSVQILVYPQFSVKLRDGVVVSIKAAEAPHVPGPAASRAGAAVQDPDDPKLQDLSAVDRAKALKTILQRAIDQVEMIVNQPVESFPESPERRAASYGPPWFHPGAITPDFAHVDVRKTQERSYAANEWVRSDVSPGLVFHGADLEFNSMTKYFYLDRSVPKKLLSESDMLEINRLYRIIGKCCAVVGPLPPNTRE